MGPSYEHDVYAWLYQLMSCDVNKAGDWSVVSHTVAFQPIAEQLSGMIQWRPSAFEN